MSNGDLSAEELSTWYYASDVRNMLAEELGDYSAAASKLWNQLKSGLLAAAAENAYYADRPGEPADIVKIAAQTWSKIDVGNWYHNEMWRTNDLTIFVPDTSNSNVGKSLHLIGVRFERKGVLNLIRKRGADLIAVVEKEDSPPPPVYAFSEAVPEKTKIANEKVERRGRPRSEYWDDLWVHVCGLIYDGTLDPANWKQADIENAMLEWAETHDYFLAESSARPRAAKLWLAINKAKK